MLVNTNFLSPQDHQTTTIMEAITLPPLPAAARRLLDSFYELRGVASDDIRGKIDALRVKFLKDDCFLASSEGEIDDLRELFALENYVVAKLDHLV